VCCCSLLPNPSQIPPTSLASETTRKSATKKLDVPGRGGVGYFGLDSATHPAEPPLPNAKPGSRTSLVPRRLARVPKIHTVRIWTTKQSTCQCCIASRFGLLADRVQAQTLAARTALCEHWHVLCYFVVQILLRLVSQIKTPGAEYNPQSQTEYLSIIPPPPHTLPSRGEGGCEEGEE